MISLSEQLDQISRTDDFDSFDRQRQIVEPKILDSHDSVLLWRLGQIYRQRQLWSDAEKLLLEAIKWEPSLPEPYRDLGLLYMRREDLPWRTSLGLAKNFLLDGIKAETISNDHSAVTHTLLGAILESLGETEDAEAELRKALKIDPHYEEAQYNLAMLLGDAHAEEKLDLLRQSIVEDPEYFVALRDLGFELLKRKQFTEAECCLSKSLSLDQADVALRWYLGQLKWMQGDILSAESHFKKAVELNPGLSKSHELLGRLYQHCDRPSEANQELFAAIELDPSNEDSISAYIKFLQEFEEPELAAKMYSTAKRNALLPGRPLAELEARFARLQ